MSGVLVALGERDSRRGVAVLLSDDHDTQGAAVHEGVEVLPDVVKLSFEELTVVRPDTASVRGAHEAASAE